MTTRPAQSCPASRRLRSCHRVPTLVRRPYRTGDLQPRIAALHADSWRRHYRGAYADTYLDGDLLGERTAVWSARLAAPDGTATIIAERAGRLTGFVHVMLDADPRWGSLVDNLHVDHSEHRAGIGAELMAYAARAVLAHGSSPALHLWVLEQNIRAQKFHLACGGAQVETGTVSAPRGNPTLLNGTPRKYRMAWPDATGLVSPDWNRSAD
uniref:GNAT family N-acetyltransferase n=1 Tax=Paractinoplanes polyasparticus TaxID=2856853 RepID=UPI0027DF6854|nr:GNAT family N-acetyltransferase [Actinoplanes polyasparticus]